jgi:ketosteroid isomerase-like protein
MLPLTAETETLCQLYAALNRGDIPAVIALLDPQIEWSETWDPASTCKGLAEVEAHFAGARKQWAEGACEPEEFIVAGNENNPKIVVFVLVRVRLKDETEWREGRLGDVYTFRDGKIIDGRSFLDRQQALDWPGVPFTSPAPE